VAAQKIHMLYQFGIQQALRKLLNSYALEPL
jgi:hypothetical protein